MIQVQIDDTIVDIVDKISEVTKNEIILDFPLGHPILHNYISLKVLKSKAGEKKLIIATNDKIGKKIGKSIGIEYTVIKNSNFIENSTNSKILEHNFTFLQYLKFQLKSYKNELFDYLDTHKRFNSLGKYSRIQQEKIPIRFFLLALIASVFIFVFIYYFAISKSYIYIVPEKTVKKEASNFIFKENIGETILGNNKYIQVSKISKTIHSSDTFAATNIIEDNNRANGTVTIYNTLTEQQSLVPNTRFSYTGGILFRSTDWINIPAGVIDNFGNITPGTTQIELTADLVNEQGEYVGEKGNIKKGSKLTIPGLGEENIEVIYAETTNDFQGGSNEFKKSISQEDIERAEQIFTNKIKNQALDGIKEDILYSNNINNEKRDILTVGDSIQYSSAEIVFQNAEVGDIRDNFTLNGSITIYAYSYNENEILTQLKSTLSEKTLEGVEKLEHIDNNSIRLSEVISLEQDPFNLKGTFEIEALYIHDFLSEDNALINQLRSEIRGMDKKEAENFILNNRKISSVRIQIRPFFINNISNIYNNIVFKID